MGDLDFLKEFKVLPDDSFERNLSAIAGSLPHAAGDITELVFLQANQTISNRVKEPEIQDALKIYLFRPMVQFLSTLLGRNLSAFVYDQYQPGVQTNLPDHTNSVLKAYPDMYVILQGEHRHTVVVLEAKRPSVIPTDDYPSFDCTAFSKLNSFQTALL